MIQDIGVELGLQGCIYRSHEFGQIWLSPDLMTRVCLTDWSWAIERWAKNCAAWTHVDGGSGEDSLRAALIALEARPTRSMNYWEMFACAFMLLAVGLTLGAIASWAVRP